MLRSAYYSMVTTCATWVALIVLSTRGTKNNPHIPWYHTVDVAMRLKHTVDVKLTAARHVSLICGMLEPRAINSVRNPLSGQVKSGTSRPLACIYHTYTVYGMCTVHHACRRLRLLIYRIRYIMGYIEPRAIYLLTCITHSMQFAIPSSRAFAR